MSQLPDRIDNSQSQAKSVRISRHPTLSSLAAGTFVKRETRINFVHFKIKLSPHLRFYRFGLNYRNKTHYFFGFYAYMNLTVG